MHLNVSGVGSNPLEQPYLDELNLSILENYSEFLFSKKSDDDWEVVIQM